MNILLPRKKLSSRLSSARKNIFYYPERFWTPTLTTLIFFALTMLTFDGLIFWEYALKIDKPAPEPNVSIETLNRAQFNQIVENLKKKERHFNNLLNIQQVVTSSSKNNTVNASTTPEDI